MRGCVSSFDASELPRWMDRGKIVARFWDGRCPMAARSSIYPAEKVEKLAISVSSSWGVRGVILAVSLLGAQGAFALPRSPGPGAQVLEPLRLADSGTADPSDSGTDESSEDEPSPGTDDPARGPSTEEAPPPENFGCPVREQGPFPMLV